MQIACHRCRGSGVEPVSDSRRKVLAALKRLGTATRLEIHEAVADGNSITATHQQIRRLLAAGVVLAMDDEIPARYRLVEPARGQIPCAVRI